MQPASLSDTPTQQSGATLADVHRLLDVHHATSESLKHPSATIASEAPQELHWLMYIASLMYIMQPACVWYVDLFSRQLYLSTLLLWHLFFFVLLTVRIVPFALAGA